MLKTLKDYGWVVAIVLAIIISGTVGPSADEIKIIVEEALTGVESDSLGSTRYPNGLISSYFQATDVGSVVVATSTFGTAGSMTAGGCWTRNGLDSCEISGSFTDGTSTLFAILNPFRATSTVSLAALQITVAASTSQDFFVATSSTAFLPVTGLFCNLGKAAKECFGEIIDEATIATSSTASDGTWTGTHGEIVSNGSMQRINATGPTLSATSTAGISPIILGPDDWVVGYATSTFSLGVVSTDGTTCNRKDGATTTVSTVITSCDGILHVNNFDGNYFLRFEKW